MAAAAFATPAALLAAIGGTFTRATTAYALDANGAFVSAASGVLRADDRDGPTLTRRGFRVESARTNGIRNSAATGAVPGAPGTMPTNWAAANNGSALAWSVIATGAENGMEYVDLRLSGTAAAPLTAFIAFETTTGIAAANGQAWSTSVFGRITAGSLTNITAIQAGQNTRDAGGVAGTYNVTGADFSAAMLAATRLSASRIVMSGTLADATTAFVYPYLVVSHNAGAVDVTMRLAWPQTEQGPWPSSPIRTTAAAGTRNADQLVIPSRFWSPGSGAFSVMVRGRLGGIGAGVDSYLLTLSDGTANNSLRLFRRGSDQKAVVQSRTGNVLQVDAAAISGNPDWNTDAIYAFAARCSASNFALYANGVSVATATTYGPPPITTLNLGANVAAANVWDGWIEEIEFTPTAWDNATLAAKSAAA